MQEQTHGDLDSGLWSGRSWRRNGNHPVSHWRTHMRSSLEGAAGQQPDRTEHYQIHLFLVSLPRAGSAGVVQSTAQVEFGLSGCGSWEQLAHRWLLKPPWSFLPGLCSASLTPLYCFTPGGANPHSPAASPGSITLSRSVSLYPVWRFSADCHADEVFLRGQGQVATMHWAWVAWLLAASLLALSACALPPSFHLVADHVPETAMVTTDSGMDACACVGFTAISEA